MWAHLLYSECAFCIFNMKQLHSFMFVSTDLSKNRLTDFSTDMCQFVALETLNLYHNCIKTIPDSIISLQSLTSLNIRCCKCCIHSSCISAVI